MWHGRFDPPVATECFPPADACLVVRLGSDLGWFAAVCHYIILPWTLAFPSARIFQVDGKGNKRRERGIPMKRFCLRVQGSPVEKQRSPTMPAARHPSSLCVCVCACVACVLSSVRWRHPLRLHDGLLRLQGQLPARLLLLGR